jgi:hypothetical protein
MPRSTPSRVILVVAILSAAALACRANLGGPTSDASPPSSSPAEATEASQAWEQALAGAGVTGKITVIFTEAQLTSAIATRLASQEDPVLTSPSVVLRDGTIQIFGIIQRGPIEANVRLEITPTLSADGRLGFEVTSADFGPFPASQGVRAGISNMMSEALSGPMGTLATGFRITSVAVADGELAIVAELR